MKKNVRILSVVVLTAIYCFELSAFTASIGHSSLQNSPNYSQERVMLDLYVNLFCHSSPPENLVGRFNHLPEPTQENPVNRLTAIITSTERANQTGFSQYINYARNIVIHSRKTDIIFPFHYFW